MNPGAAWQLTAALSALGFYMFLAVWVGVFLWSRTKERLAIQETLQKLIQSGTQLSPQVIDSLRHTKPRTSAEITARVRTFRYWGLFLVVLGSIIALSGLQFTDSPNHDLRDIPGAGIIVFIIPGLFCVAYSVITNLVSGTSKS